jgi:indolepyruvate ferredoxin oxidoreductase beta subunit
MREETLACRIFFTGVGGQGTLLATRLVGEAALEAGIPVLMSEIHGMAQRGGVVESSVALGHAVSPMIADGEADIVVAFEPLEAARALPKCNSKTTVLTGITPIPPFAVIIGQSVYPDLEKLYAMVAPYVGSLIQVDAERMARSLGAQRSSNVLMIGVLAGLGVLPISKNCFEQALRIIIPEKFLETNQRAFDAGFSFGSGTLTSARHS